MSEASTIDVSWRTRLRAWWEGYDVHELSEWQNRHGDGGDEPSLPPSIALPKSMSLDELMADPAAPRSTAPRSTAPDCPEFAEEDMPDPVWSRAKMEISQRVFGRGFIMPGGGQHAVEVTKPLGLDPVQTVLDLSLGLGGPSAALAERYGVWVTGYERNRALLDLAPSVLKTVKSGEQVHVNHLDVESLYLPRKKFDAVLSNESMHRVQDRIQLLGKIRNALKDWGQLLMTDYVLPSEEPPSPRLQTWLANRGEPVTLWTREQYEVALTNQGMDVRVIKDESGLHAEMIRADFASFVATLNANRSVTSTAVGRAALTDLAEDWSRLASLLAKGELQLLRFHAMKPEEG